MALTIPDSGEPSDPIQSRLFQSDIDAIVAGVGRTGVLTGCAVSQRAAGANMTVDVAAGRVAVANSPATVAATNVAVSAADATNPRLDLVVVSTTGVVSVLAGAAAAAPIEPTLDTTTSVVLAQLYVPAAATSVTNARITDRRVILAAPSPSIGFGDGSDGAVTISSNTTLTRDMQYGSLTVNAGVTLKTGGYKIFVTGTLTNNGTIDNSGSNGAAAGVAGAGGVQGSLQAGGSGGAGNTGAGSAGGNVTTSWPATGNAGSGGSGSGGAGGGGGSVNGFPSSTAELPLLTAVTGYIFQVIGGVSGNGGILSGSPGGGGGGGDGTNKGGGGGGGGGGVLVCTRVLTGAGAFAANGGNGGTPTTGNCGGGGGGNPGWVSVITTDKTGWTGTTSTTAGVGGSGVGTGNAGGAASSGGRSQIVAVS